MRRTYVFIISLLAILIISLIQAKAQDTILFPLKVKVGLEISGPAIYMAEKKTLNAEGYITVDINEKISPAFGAGYNNYQYSQYNYDYQSKGIFIRSGADFNLLKPDKSMGKYWAGIGLRYGLSLYSSGVPSIQQKNYWGESLFSVDNKTNWAHFIEVSPGVRAEIFNNISVGWTISIRMLLYSGSGKDLKPINIPGFGNGEKLVSTGINYFITWNIPYKKRRVIIPVEKPEDPDDEESNIASGNTGIRQ